MRIVNTSADRDALVPQFVPELIVVGRGTGATLYISVGLTAGAWLEVSSAGQSAAQVAAAVAASSGAPVEFCVAMSDEVTPIDSPGVAIVIRAPFPFTLTRIILSLNVASSDLDLFVNLSKDAVPIFFTDPRINASERLSTINVTGDDFPDIGDLQELSFSVVDPGTGDAAGLKVWLLGVRN